MNYFGYKISDNMIETRDGFLICRNVPISRTGSQEYRESEIREDGDFNKTVKVYRDEKEVFSKEAIASFEGKTVCDDHPQEVLVNNENFKNLVKGHAENVHRGDGEFKDNLVADLIINDKDLIEKVMYGKREISCGYECDWEEKDGKLYQTNIRGNHIAVVECGRAGSNVAIRDKKTNGGTGMKSKFLKTIVTALVDASKDASKEEAKEMLDKALDAIDAVDSKTGDGKSVDTKAKDEDVQKTKEDKMQDTLDEILELLKKQNENKEETKTSDNECENTKDTKDSKDEETEEEKKKKEEESGEQVVGTGDSVSMDEVSKELSPIIAKVKDEACKKDMLDVLSKYMGKGVNPIAKVNPIATTDSTDVYAKQQSVYDKFNPHKNKGGNQ